VPDDAPTASATVTGADLRGDGPPVGPPEQAAPGDTPHRRPDAGGRGSVVPAGPAASSGTVDVDVVLVVRDGSPWLARCLDALAAQTVRPRRLVVVDDASTDTSAAIAEAHQPVRRVVPDVRVLRLTRRAPLAVAVDAGVAALPVVAETPEDASGAGDRAGRWVWVLHHDTLPHRDALARLHETVLRSPSVGVAGPKRVSAADPRRLVELGLQITRTGRRIASPAVGETDQGQYDGRSDVLAVGTAGMLLRRDVHELLGGFDPSFVEHGAALDLGWRAQLADHRVVVVPSAVVRDASGLTSDPPDPTDARATREADRGARRAARQVALARCSPLAMPLLAVWIACSAVVSAVVLLVAKRPRRAWRELTDLAALTRPGAVLSARWRGRRTKRLRRDDLATLFVTPGAAMRTTADHIQDAVTPERTRPRREVVTTAEPGPVDDDVASLTTLPASLPRRVLSHPGFLAVLAVLVATVAAWRDPIRAGALSPTHTGLAGGQLRPVTTGADGLWHAFRDAWHGAGLGTGLESGPHLAVLSGLTWLAERVPGVAESRSSAGLTIAWLLFLAPALAAWSAYLAGRVVTPSRLARALGALVWAGVAVLPQATTAGRLSAAAAHVLLPFVLAGFVLAARRDGTFTGAFATALATAVLGAFAPSLLALSVVAALVLLLVGPGARRWRALVLLVVPGALLGPWAARFVDDPRLLLSGPGLVSTGPGPTWLTALLGQPDADLGLTSWLLAPVVVLGLLGLAVRGAGRAERIALGVASLLGVLGLAVALASAHVVLGTAQTGVGTSRPAHLWPGLGLQLWVAALVVGLLAGSRVPLRTLTRRSVFASGHGAEPPPARTRGARARRVGAVTVASLAVALAVLPTAGLLVRWGAVGLGDRLTVGQATLPAVAVEQGSGPLGNRLLLLRPSDDVTDFVLVGQEPGDLLRDLDRPAGADDAALVDAVAEIVGGRGGDSLDASRLAALGVGFVQVRGGVDDPLSRRLDASGGLSRLGTSEHGILWKVQPTEAAPGAPPATAPSRARLVDGQGRLLAAVPTDGPHAALDERLPAAGGDGPRYLTVAEPSDWAHHAVVTFDDAVLQPVAGRDAPTYALPATAGTVRVDLAAADPWWRLGQAVLLGFVVFMAVPFGNRRSRRQA
jgi:GT2 family glycosyltransferase